MTHPTDPEFKYTMRVVPDDEGVLHALRGLAYHAQKRKQKMKSCNGVTWPNFRHDGFVTFWFTAPSYIDEFRAEATRLLPKGCWREI